MELATAALGSLLPKLGTLLSNEYKLQKGVRGEIKFLQAEMESMQAVLSMLSKLPSHQITDLDKIWVRDLKELSYDIEDSVDIFTIHIDAPVHAKPHSFKRFFDKTMGLLTKAKVRHRVANDIEDIKKRIKEGAERRQRYQLEGVAAGPDTKTVDPRVLACFEQVSNLVGTDVPVKKISDMLTKGKGAHHQKPMVVSIVGVGGLGKTTIATLVYQSLGDKFDCKAFVSISLRPNMQQILSSILRQISKDECRNAREKDLQELILSIREFLKDKRYFIVIDDVWSVDAWKTIKGALIENILGSKVILTTRNVDVATLSSVDGDMYELDPLSDEDSKRLLSKRIFNEEEGILSELVEVTMKILKKCGGIPLAIITIASMLASIPNKTKYEWYDVYKSMGSGFEKDKSLGNMREILHLSYGDLPSYLKPCLLYLSVFPEDSEIPRKVLIRLWIAEGFVVGEQGSDFYALGERYFNMLVNRSMIQPVGVDICGIAGACRAHDMILDLIISLSAIAGACRAHDMILDLIISLSAQENFITISAPHLISPWRAGNIRRLSLQGSDIDSKDDTKKVILPETVDMSHVRTLIALGDAFQWMPPLSWFSVLHVLVLKYFHNNKNNLSGLGSLHHLRYLELRGKVGPEHLEEIGNLKHLKTLDLWDTPIQELPASIFQLRRLERLITKHNLKFPDGIGNLVSLQQLAVLDLRKSLHNLAELSNLGGLRILAICGLEEIDESRVKTFLQILSDLHNLHTLYIECNGLYSLDCMPDQWRGPAQLQYIITDFSPISKLPRWFSSLTELSCLSIEVNMLTQDGLQLLGALPMLRILNLGVYIDGTTEERLVIGGDQPFRSLTDFNFEHEARCWLVFAQGAMPKLQKLELYFNVWKRDGGVFDVGLENLTSLKQVKVTVDCDKARVAEVEDTDAKYRDAIEKHPNHPTLELSRVFEWRMITDENEDYGDASKQPSSDLSATDTESDTGIEASEQSCSDLLVLQDVSNQGHEASDQSQA